MIDIINLDGCGNFELIHLDKNFIDSCKTDEYNYNNYDNYDDWINDMLATIVEDNYDVELWSEVHLNNKQNQEQIKKLIGKIKKEIK